jgi:hypothetical protein
MKQNSLLELQILFYSNQKKPPKTYATFANFSDITQTALIYKAMTEKYGPPESIKNENDLIDRTNVLMGYEVLEDDEDMSIIKNELFHLAGIALWGPTIEIMNRFISQEYRALWGPTIEIIMWARNILSIPLSANDFYVLYYKPDVIDKLIEHHQIGIEKCKEKCDKQIYQDFNQIQKDF